MSKWTDFVKDWAAKNNTTYGCALSNPKCSADYRKENPTKKQQKEAEAKAEEDKRKQMIADEEIRRIEKRIKNANAIKIVLNTDFDNLVEEAEKIYNNNSKAFKDSWRVIDSKLGDLPMNEDNSGTNLFAIVPDYVFEDDDYAFERAFIDADAEAYLTEDDDDNYYGADKEMIGLLEKLQKKDIITLKYVYDTKIGKIINTLIEDDKIYREKKSKLTEKQMKSVGMYLGRYGDDGPERSYKDAIMMVIKNVEEEKQLKEEEEKRKEEEKKRKEEEKKRKEEEENKRREEQIKRREEVKKYEAEKEKQEQKEEEKRLGVEKLASKLPQDINKYIASFLLESDPLKEFDSNAGVAFLYYALYKLKDIELGKVQQPNTFTKTEWTDPITLWNGEKKKFDGGIVINSMRKIQDAIDTIVAKIKTDAKKNKDESTATDWRISVYHSGGVGMKQGFRIIVRWDGKKGQRGQQELWKQYYDRYLKPLVDDKARWEKAYERAEEKKVAKMEAIAEEKKKSVADIETDKSPAELVKIFGQIMRDETINKAYNIGRYTSWKELSVPEVIAKVKQFYDKPPQRQRDGSFGASPKPVWEEFVKRIQTIKGKGIGSSKQVEPEPDGKGMSSDTCFTEKEVQDLLKNIAEWVKEEPVEPTRAEIVAKARAEITKKKSSKRGLDKATKSTKPYAYEREAHQQALKEAYPRGKGLKKGSQEAKAWGEKMRAMKGKPKETKSTKSCCKMCAGKGCYCCE